MGMGGQVLGAAMTDHIRSLRLLLSRTPSGDEREALEAAIKRCELPVLTRCGLCAYIAHPDEHAYCRGMGHWKATDPDAIPPDWCPLRHAK